MYLTEYRTWLKDNANKEELKAYDVVKIILDYHFSDKQVDVECFPRKVLQTKRERIEFDLVLQVSWTSNREYKRIIGIEFKELDFAKVVQQAVIRRNFVDYMYIATRNIIPGEVDFLRLVDYGIGWVMWGDDFVKLLIPAHYNSSRLLKCLDYLAEKAVEKAVEKKLKEMKLGDYLW